ncbi:hypothetical protein DGG96_03545 [Legionella qingyii]|uniref:Uncharacterized protein n=1 Tax=Legionella qingyii TaxID=2184757 RepID=A0A317U935_9GAMM|nr:hypothetical protein DGG96_03545 [Legionella qingyii]
MHQHTLSKVDLEIWKPVTQIELNKHGLPTLMLKKEVVGHVLFVEMDVVKLFHHRIVVYVRVEPGLRISPHFCFVFSFIVIHVVDSDVDALTY